MRNINILEPNLFFKSKKKLIDTLRKNQISTASKSNIKKFEKKISQLDGSKYVVPTNTGSSALYVGFKAVGVEKNDLIIMPSYTFVATANACLLSGAFPWFFDLEKKKLTIDLDQVENKLKLMSFKKGKFFYHKKTKQRIFAICPVYTLGFLPDLIKVKRIAKKFNLKIIADAACAIGAKYNKKSLALYNDVVCYSFNGNKSLTAGGGGAISTNNKVIYKNSFLLTTNGKSDQYFHKSFGLNLRITGIHAALGYGELNEFKKIQMKKNRLRKKYINTSQINYFETYFLDKNINSMIWLNFLISKKNIKSIFFKNAKRNKLNLAPFWTPMHLQPFLKNELIEKMKNTNFVWKKILVLPSSLNINSNDFKKIEKFLIKNSKFL